MISGRQHPRTDGGTLDTKACKVIDNRARCRVLRTLDSCFGDARERAGRDGLLSGDFGTDGKRAIHGFQTALETRALTKRLVARASTTQRPSALAAGTEGDFVGVSRVRRDASLRQVLFDFFSGHEMKVPARRQQGEGAQRPRRVPQRPHPRPRFEGRPFPVRAAVRAALRAWPRGCFRRRFRRRFRSIVLVMLRDPEGGGGWAAGQRRDHGSKIAQNVTGVETKKGSFEFTADRCYATAA